jgi:hypothetical protein
MQAATVVTCDIGGRQVPCLPNNNIASIMRAGPLLSGATLH